MQPLYNNVFVQIIPTQQTSSGLLINSNLIKVKVIKAGLGTKDNPMLLKDGDLCLINSGVGVPHYEDGINGLFINDREIISIL